MDRKLVVTDVRFSVDGLLEFIAKNHSLYRHPFFVHLLYVKKENSLQKQDPGQLARLLKTQIPFGICVKEWTFVLARLLCKCPQVEGRLATISNLYDEHGRGEVGKAHVNTFKALLNLTQATCEKKLQTEKGFSITTTNNPSQTAEEKEKGKMTASEEACIDFNQTLNDYIRDKTWQEGLAFLGAIEAVYALVSAQLNVFLSWQLQIPSKDIPHYDEHAQLDGTHARELLNPLFLDETSTKDLAFRKALEQACLQGIQTLEQVYLKMMHELVA